MSHWKAPSFIVELAVAVHLKLDRAPAALAAAAAAAAAAAIAAAAMGGASSLCWGNWRDSL